MNRKAIIVLGVIMWTIAIGIGVRYLLAGQLFQPAAMAAVAGVWLTLRLTVLAKVPVESES